MNSGRVADGRKDLEAVFARAKEKAALATASEAPLPRATVCQPCADANGHEEKHGMPLIKSTSPMAALIAAYSNGEVIERSTRMVTVSANSDGRSPSAFNCQDPRTLICASSGSARSHVKQTLAPAMEPLHFGSPGLSNRTRGYPPRSGTKTGIPRVHQHAPLPLS